MSFSIRATLAAVLSVGAAASVEAATIFATGFESPGYSVGTLIGQNGWLQDIGTSSVATIQSTTVLGGSQALLVDPSGQPNFARAVKTSAYNPFAPGNDSTVSFRGSFLIGSTGIASEYRFTAFDGALQNIGAYQITSSSTAGILNGTGAAAISLDVWHDFEFRLDFEAATMSAYLDDNLVSSRAIGNGLTTFGAFAITTVPAGSGTRPLYVDDIEISSVAEIPEPATSALLAVGVLAAIRMRRS